MSSAPSTRADAASSPAIVITGASYGIGREIARIAAHEHTALLLVARSSAPLVELRDELTSTGSDVAWLSLDLRNRDAGERIEAALTERGWYCDVLVHGAGLGLVGPAHALDRADQVAMLDVNARALTELALRFLPGMVRRGRGGVLAVGSVAGYFPGPNMAVYYSTKAYVRSLANALYAETKGSGVNVTCLSPGFVTTDFLSRSGLQATRLRKILPRITAVDAARAGWRGFRAGRRVVVPGLTNRIVTLVSGLIPTRGVLWLIKRLQH